MVAKDSVAVISSTLPVISEDLTGIFSVPEAIVWRVFSFAISLNIEIIKYHSILSEIEQVEIQELRKHLIVNEGLYVY